MTAEGVLREVGARVRESALRSVAAWPHSPAELEVEELQKQTRQAESAGGSWEKGRERQVGPTDGAREQLEEQLQRL